MSDIWYRSSSIGSYDWCPWQYFLAYELGFHQETGGAALVGTITHWVLETLARLNLLDHDHNSKLWNYDLLFRIACEHYKKEQPFAYAKIQPSKFKLALDCIGDILESGYSPLSETVTHLERFFEYNLNGFDIKGTMDRIDIHPGGDVELVDYKTGSRRNFATGEPVTYESLKESIQPQIYVVAMSKMFPEATGFLVTFYYLMDGGPLSIHYSSEEIYEVEEKITNKIRAIHADNVYPRDISWRCKTVCHYGKSGLCDVIHEERVELGLGFVRNKYKNMNGVVQYNRGNKNKKRE